MVRRSASRARPPSQPAQRISSLSGYRTQYSRRQAGSQRSSRRHNPAGPPRPLAVCRHGAPRTGRTPSADEASEVAHALPEPGDRPARARPSWAKPIGTVADLIVAIGDRYPPVTGIVVKTNGREIFLHWSSVASLDASGATLRHDGHRHQPLPAAAQRDPPQAGSDGPPDRGHRRPQGGARQRPAAGRGRGRPAPGRGRRRRLRPAAPAGHRGPMADDRPGPAPRGSGALHRLGGRRSAGADDRQRQAARSPQGPGRAAPGRPGHDHRPALARRPGGRHRSPGRRGRGRRHRRDGARDPGRHPGGPRAGPRRRHPRGDGPGRGRRPGGGPVRGEPRGDPGPDGEGRGRRKSRS